jgi:ribonuclease P protein component
VPKYGHTAVERNTVKRRLRELLRTEVMAMLPNVDVVVRASPSAYRATFDELRRALQAALTKLAPPSPETHGGAPKGVEDGR